MSTDALAWASLVPLPLLAVLGGLCLVPLALGWRRRAPGTLSRAATCLFAVLFLAGPEQVHRIGTRLPSIALLAVDRSGSMAVADRAALAEAEAKRLAAEAAGRPGLVLRRVDITDAGSDGTRLFAAIGTALADIPPDQRAGVIAITDGAVTDAPKTFSLPLHALIAAAGEQIDRRLRIISAPGYGIVGQSVTIGLAVEDLGTTASGIAHLGWTVDGAPAGETDVAVGTPASITLPITRPGPLAIRIAAGALSHEASILNNSAAFVVNGVRDRLRVLLISGEPHPGERTWRRLLKADPAVDLVHFTILRPPGKEDGTPVNQLALIAFPVRELFVDKIGQFDLIILDRFSGGGILPISYLQNIADYVEHGGALLIAAGPEFTDARSIARGPIGAILPALPAQDSPDATPTGGFRPTVTALGERHPVTAGLPGDVPGGMPGWGPWYRSIAVGPTHGQTVLTAGAGGAPLLLLDHVGDGRVALLLSDQIWLWSRGHDGGGPQAELLRRVAHWLMKEPELDETALTARIADGRLTVERHTLAAPDQTSLEIADPAFHRSTVQPVAQSNPNRASVPATTPGLWQARWGDQTAYAVAHPGDPAEWADLRATARELRPIATSVHWLGAGDAPGLDRLTLRHHQALHLTAEHRVPLLPPWLALPLLLGGVFYAWWREGH